MIDDRIRPALESGRAMGSSLPVCVIIDEIDGATGEQNGAGFINKLVSLTFDPPNLKKREYRFFFQPWLIYRIPRARSWDEES